MQDGEKAQTAPVPFVHSIASTELVRTPDGLGVRVLATAAETDGVMGVWEATIPPGLGSPMHIHHKEHEALFLLEGRLLFEAGGERFVLEPGALFFGPRGVPHGLKSVGDVPARFIEFFLPGGLEELIGSPQEMAASIAAGRAKDQYGFEVVGPLPE